MWLPMWLHTLGILKSVERGWWANTVASVRGKYVCDCRDTRSMVWQEKTAHPHSENTPSSQPPKWLTWRFWWVRCLCRMEKWPLTWQWLRNQQARDLSLLTVPPISLQSFSAVRPKYPWIFVTWLTCHLRIKDVYGASKWTVGNGLWTCLYFFFLIINALLWVEINIYTLIYL